MRLRDTTPAVALAAVLAAGCGSDPDNSTSPIGTGDGGTQPTGGAGTCASPIRLDTAATRNGNTWVYEGTTEGHPNNLHPYAEDPPTDSNEAVIEFRVPQGWTNVKVSTEGSSFDTVLYVREACSQVAGGTDVALADDTATADPMRDANHGTIYLTGLTAGQVRFLVVDGRMMGKPPSGRFRLTVTPFTPGAMGNPCIEPAEGDPTCSGAGLRCSPANRCVPTVAVGARCDDRGVNNTCAMGSACVSDPTPAMAGAENPATCATPGTRPGSRCRDGMGAARCDAPLVCNDAMENPVCVRQLAREQACDPMGLANRCMTGLRCRTLGMDGMSFCENAM